MSAKTGPRRREHYTAIIAATDSPSLKVAAAFDYLRAATKHLPETDRLAVVGELLAMADRAAGLQ